MKANFFRYLGFAFASADLLLELDGEGNIAFSAGAAGRLINMDAETLRGRHWRELIAQDDQPVMEALLAGLDPGARRGPIALELAATQDGKPATIGMYVCQLPQLAPAVSCAISTSAVQACSSTLSPKGAFRLHDAETFETLTKGLAELSRATGIDLDIAFIELGGMGEIDKANHQNGKKLLKTIAGTLRAESYGGMSAARLGEDRFAVVRERTKAQDKIAARVEAATQRSGVSNVQLTVNTTAVALDTETISNEKMLRALRYALDNFISAGLGKTTTGSLGEIFQQQVQDTMNRAGAFNALVDARKFKLNYQPIVALKTGALHHYEVLVRFTDGVSPFGMIRMAEELALVERFDIAMIEAVIARMKERDGASLSLAVNISGRSLMSVDFHTALMQLLKEKKAPQQRLIFEVTESAALTDLNLADRHVQTLRQAGYPVCLDDFGSGAASFPYLKMLTVDSVKIDGQYVRELTSSSRDGEMIRHLVNLCKSLKVKTTAEMIEDMVVAEQLAELGVDYGQGFFFGKPQAQPLRPDAAAKDTKPSRGSMLAKRKGAKETWG